MAIKRLIGIHVSWRTDKTVEETLFPRIILVNGVNEMHSPLEYEKIQFFNKKYYIFAHGGWGKEGAGVRTHM